MSSGRTYSAAPLSKLLKQAIDEPRDRGEDIDVMFVMFVLSGFKQSSQLVKVACGDDDFARVCTEQAVALENRGSQSGRSAMRHRMVGFADNSSIDFVQIGKALD